VIFFFNGASTTEIYSLSLHDALPISNVPSLPSPRTCCECSSPAFLMSILLDRKSTRLNSSHVEMSYAVFCLKKRLLLYVSAQLFFIRAMWKIRNVNPAGWLAYLYCVLGYVLTGLDFATVFFFNITRSPILILISLHQQLLI